MESLWTDNMSVGEPELDKEHIQIFAKINDLKCFLDSYSPLNKSKNTIENKKKLMELLKFINEYANYHFLHEEKYMEENNYPNINEHKKLHEKYTEFIKKYMAKSKKTTTSKKEYDKDILKYLKELNNYLIKWWKNHILVEDRKYFKYIENN